MPGSGTTSIPRELEMGTLHIKITQMENKAGVGWL
jgi:hypothetical protein